MILLSGACSIAIEISAMYEYGGFTKSRLFWYRLLIAYDGDGYAYPAYWLCVANGGMSGLTLPYPACEDW